MERDIRISWRVNLAVLAAMVVFFLLVYALGDVATPFVVAFIFAYALNPAVEALQRHKVPKGLAAVLFAVLFLVALAAALAVIVLVLRREIPALLDNLPIYLETFKTQYYPHIQSYMHDVFGPAADMEFDEIVRQAKDRLMGLSAQSYASAASYVFTVLAGTLNFFLAIFTLLLIPVLLIYLLADYDKMRAAFFDALPRGYRREITTKLAQVKSVIKDFLKGQVLVALILGVLYSIGLAMVGVDMPILVGMASGIGNMIPYVGTILGIVTSLVLVLLKYHDILHPVLVLAVFAIVQTLEAYVVTPKVVGDRLGLHPLVVIFSLLLFGKVMGFVGMLIAVPVAAVLKVFLSDFVRDYKESAFYGEE